MMDQKFLQNHLQSFSVIVPKDVQFLISAMNQFYVVKDRKYDSNLS